MHSLGAHTVVLDVLADVVVDGGRQGHVEEAIGVHAARQCLDVRVQLGEGVLFRVAPADVRVAAEELLQLLCLRAHCLGEAERAC